MPRRSATNKQIADILREIGLIDEAEGVPFKPQAYEVAADQVAALGEDLSDLYKACGATCIDAIPGIGKSIAEKIEELVTTGRLKSYEALKKKYPFDMLALTGIQNVGPKTALALYRALKVKTVRDLERVARAGKVRRVPGFGRKSEDGILKGIGFLREHEGRFRLHDLLPFAEGIVAKLRAVPGVTHCEAAGSLRRMKETVGDVDLVMTATDPKRALDAFVSLPEVSQALERGENRAAVRYRYGVNGDLLVLKPEEWATALLHFTGSRDHNVVLRERAIKRGMKLSEYGLFKGKKRVVTKTEQDVYEALGMDWMPPEIRENRGEIEAALAHKVPALVGYGDLKGDLQVQTGWSDGDASIEAMAGEAKRRGLSYLAVTDHTQALAMANGLDEKRLLKQGKEIDALNKKLREFRVLKSSECDVRRDGSLDLDDAALKTLDLVCVSVHSSFTLSEKEQTERIIRAFKHPLTNVFFHPTGRIVNAREAYAVDFPRLLRAAREYGVALEVNGSERLDLKDAHVREAVEAGVKLVIDSDAHKAEHFDNLRYGISQARRGWATRADVLNTKPVGAFLKALKGLKK
ncbi:DNA polymerase/3'-5' exonuclease PolX [Patescibacteria group bacterium]|nr:MAG: DNA polymerase/3'-5' exonuclease PolX [Patescibacteria group bacterium]